MPMKSFLFAAFLLIGVGLLNQSAFRVMETEKAILLEFGNLIDADIKPGLHFKLPIAQAGFSRRDLLHAGEKAADRGFLCEMARGRYRALLHRHIV